MHFLTTVLSAPAADSIDGLLEFATKMVTWLITTMTSFVGFITSNPLILWFIMPVIISFGVGLILRFIRSAGI